MKLSRRNFLHLAAGAAALPVSSRFAWAQAYPSRPVRIIVPFAPAGSTDIVARLIGQWLSERLGHVPATIVNKLLKERPPIRGISLPGMPDGSPGMTGQKTEPFVTYEFGDSGSKVYARD